MPTNFNNVQLCSNIDLSPSASFVLCCFTNDIFLHCKPTNVVLYLLLYAVVFHIRYEKTRVTNKITCILSTYLPISLLFLVLFIGWGEFKLLSNV